MVARDARAPGGARREALGALTARVGAVTTRPPGPDLREPNLLAAELDQIADACRDVLADAAAPADEVINAAESLREVSQLADRLRQHVTASRFATLERIHEGLTRLRALSSTAQLVPQAAQELARCCDFDRAIVSGVRGSSWRVESVWIKPDHDPELARRIEDYVTGSWVPLASGVHETELVRRRTPILVRASETRPRENLMTISESPAFVAAPIVAHGRVVGFLHADCVRGGRNLTTIDRDNIASFAEGFGLVFERAALLERLERQRTRVLAAFDATERDLAGLDEAETVLIRRDREAVAVVRLAAGLRKISVSPIDQLLTVRERQVLDLMVEGARNRQIADQLVVAEETVKSHVRSISRKLSASSRADAVSRYLQLRLRENA